MDLDAPAPAEASRFSPADRIAELNEIDTSIATLLSAASEAIGILSNQPTSEAQAKALQNPEAARSAFTTAADTYFSTLSSIEVRLRRQVYALEEANLIRPGDERDSRRGRAIGGDSSLTKVGGGPLDPSWLNARASDKVGAGMKRELLSRAREFVERADQGTQDLVIKDDATQDQEREMG
ncbi:uncharacterized protein PV06_01666 [Exophiala oligosperma]|uniref:Mediator of RNA polymerase II transcription subunit 11 n=2 Tax=Chaetothyriales TaxID=34395 RepID=A0A0D2DU01_9EURO|nr:uncharacterized protein PV06_01666 [Exophiala oligosperma]KAJ9617740.1 hypothetical protein H2204_013493 [Knufia peltigerae]KIW45970.1 hypothetical protein PV06_01666 [Exophiala oligosperma]